MTAVPVLDALEAHGGVLLDKKYATTQSGLKGQLISKPDNSDAEVCAVILVAPNDTYGDGQDYSEANALVVLRNASGSPTTAVRCRITFDGGVGCTALHVAPGVNGDDSAATQAAWINPSIDAVGLIIDQAPAGLTPVQPIFVVREQTGDKRVEVDKDFNVTGYQTDGITSAYRLESAAAAVVARGLLKTLDNATMGLLIVGQASGSQTADLAQFKNGATVQLRVNKAGFIVNAKKAAIADGDLNASEGSWYLDDTAGAPKIIFKLKDSAGTAFTRTVGMSNPVVKSSGTLTATGSLTEDVLATITDPGRYYLAADLNTMANGDTVIVKVYGKALSGGTERLIDQFTLVNIQDAPLLLTPETPSPHHYKVSIACSAARSIPWAVYQT